MKEYEIIVIGAGPAGSAFARLMADKGRSVLLLERQEYSGKVTACGGLLSRSHFDRFVHDTAVIEQEINKIDFIFPWSEVAHEDKFVTVQRCIFDRYLAEEAERRGATLMTSTTATDYQVIKPGEVTVTVKKKKTKDTETFKGKFIAFADGPFSMAAKKNPRFDPKPKKDYWAFAYEYDLDGVTIEPDVCKIYLDQRLVPWGYAWIFPDKDMMNVGVGTILPEMQDREDLKRSLEFMLEKHPVTAPLLKDAKIRRRNGGYIPMRLLDEYCDDSIALIGDSAGMVSPLFGAGIDYCLDAAAILADVVEEGLETGNLGRDQLTKYDQGMENGFFKDLKHQNRASEIIIKSLRFHKSLPTKLLSVAAFGAEYNRFNKVKTLFYPALGEPRKTRVDKSITFTHGTLEEEHH